MSATQRKQWGIILIEMLLCVLFETIILSLLIEIYFTYQQSYRIQQSLIEIEDKAQAAIDILVSEIHQAGYIGCPRLTKDFPLKAPQEYLMSVENKLSGNDHEITIRHANQLSNILLRPNTKNELIISKDTPIKKGDVLMIADCQHAQVVKVQAVSIKNDMQIITSVESIYYTFTPFSEVSRLVINRFYLDKGILMFQNIIGDKIKLVDHISNINFLYFIKNTNNIFPLEAGNVNDWSKVVGVGIKIEIESSVFKKVWHVYIAV